MPRFKLPAVVLICSIVFTLALAGVSAARSGANGHVWKTYTNVRFQYAICYPEDLLTPQSESPNSDGRKFLGKDGAQLIVYGRNNALDQSLKDVLVATTSRLAGTKGKVTYESVKPSGFVVSGNNNETIFYARTQYGHDQLKSFELTYNHAAAAVYQPLIDRLVTCFTDLAP